MAKSSGILLYRYSRPDPEFFLVHPGGPFWARKDDGAWSIPKGLVETDEDSLSAALREFGEETGKLLSGETFFLGAFPQPSRKVVDAWLMKGDLEVSGLRSNTFEVEWPPRSGTMRRFPEIDRWEWFLADTAHDKLLKGQRPIIGAALARLAQS